MIFHENHLPADYSHEISCLMCYFRKSIKIINCRLLQIIGGAFWVYFFIRVENSVDPDQMVTHEKPADLYLQFFQRINHGSAGHRLGVNFEVNKR